MYQGFTVGAATKGEGRNLRCFWYAENHLLASGTDVMRLWEHGILVLISMTVDYGDNVGGLSEMNSSLMRSYREWQAERTPDKIDGQRAKLS